MIDSVSVSDPMVLRLWWHLAPGWETRQWPLPQIAAANGVPLEWSWHDTWMATGFGRRLPRRSLCVQLACVPGQHQLVSRFAFPAPGGRS